MRSRQLQFAFADSPQGGEDACATDESVGRAYLLRIAKDMLATDLIAPAADTGRLLDEVASESNLATALLNVARNKGAPGVDGCSVAEVVGLAPSLLPKLRRALLEGSYEPGDIRRVWIPKSGGGQRGLGIPNVIDRWVQQAVLQILQPLYEPGFHPSSHGFRPHRSTATAIAEAKGYVGQGYEVVVDLDLSKFFDRVHHQRLLGRLGQRIADLRVLRLISQMLKAKVVLPDGTRVCTDEGTPQGGPLSPLLSNIVLDEFDAELQRRGLRFVRYADDCNIFVRSWRAGQRGMASVRRFLEQRLRLQVNEEKSKVARPEEIHFLGFRLRKSAEGHVEVHLSARSKTRLDARIRELTPRTWGQSVAACLAGVSRYLEDWMGYFRLCTAESESLFRRFDAHIRRRVRAIIVRQKKRPRHLYRHLRQCDVSAEAAAATAYCGRGVWFQSHTRGIETVYRNQWFHARLASLWSTWVRLNRPSSQVSVQRLLFEL